MKKTIKVISNDLKLTSYQDLLKIINFSKKKKVNSGLIIGYIILFLGIISLIASILINRFLDREYFPDITIIFIVGVSFLALILGFYIVIKEIK